MQTRGKHGFPIPDGDNDASQHSTKLYQTQTRLECFRELLDENGLETGSGCKLKVNLKDFAFSLQPQIVVIELWIIA
jgi:hypothetical protein